MRCPHCNNRDKGNSDNLQVGIKFVEMHGDYTFCFECSVCGMKYAVAYKRCAVLLRGPVVVDQKTLISQF